ncbi:MAG: hypothetical protein ABF649_18455 [Bacillus sp. (in: firmicutes)]
MSEITFLASSRPFVLPEEIKEYNSRTYFEREEDFMFFFVKEIDAGWKKEMDGLFCMPYIYEVNGVGNRLFLTYIEKYMEAGDVLEIYCVPNQHDLEAYIQRMEWKPEHIEVNVGERTYRDIHGTYQLNPQNWLKDLSHRRYITPFGITTFRACS